MKKITILLMCLALMGCNYSEGERYGQITKLSKRGYFCKSWEGELAVYTGKRTKGVGTMMFNTFEFSVQDENVVNKLKEAANSGEPLSVSYHEKYIVWPCSHDSSYVVDGVK